MSKWVNNYVGGEATEVMIWMKDCIHPLIRPCFLSPFRSYWYDDFSMACSIWPLRGGWQKSSLLLRQKDRQKARQQVSRCGDSKPKPLCNILWASLDWDEWEPPTPHPSADHKNDHNWSSWWAKHNMWTFHHIVIFEYSWHVAGCFQGLWLDAGCQVKEADWSQSHVL